jgi:FAD:protein FMN transferase
MGTEAHVIVVGGHPRLAERARSRLDHLEALWSRFLPASEINLLNDRAGSFTEVSEETLLLLERVLDGRDISGGAFDATMLDAVVAAGYDRTFDELSFSGERPAGALAPAALAPQVPWDRGLGTETPIEIHGGSACIRAGAGIDSGGIGKGLAADLVVAELLEQGAEGACVNLGGDLRVAGESPEGEGWTIGIDHPWSATPVALLGVGAGAVASSTTLKRRWLVKGEWRHHLIDPRSGLPSDSDLNHVTVIAAEAWVAEVFAKAVLLNGSEFAFNIVGGTGVEALAVAADGRVTATEGFASYLGDAALPESLAVP